MTEAPAEIAQLAGNASGPLAPLGKTPDSAATSAPSKPGGTGGNGTTANGSSAIPIEPGLLATPNGLGSHSANHEEHDQQQTPEGPPAPGSGPRVRSIKTKEQKEALEAAYIMKQYPEEDIRKALGDRIGLTEQQVQVWFSHKRRKDKKDQEEAAARQFLEKQQAQEKQEPLPSNTMAQNGLVEAVPANEMQLPAQAATAAASAQPHIITTEALPAPNSAQANQPELLQLSSHQASAAKTPAPAAPVAVPVPPAAADSQPDNAVASKAGVAKPSQPGDAAGNEGSDIKQPPIARLVQLLRAQPPPATITIEERIQIPEGDIISQELIDAVRENLAVPFRVDGPPLVYEFDDLPEINEDGTYRDEEPPHKRKRVDGDDEESARKRRASAGAKGSARNEAERMEKEKRRNEEKAERESKKKELARTKEEIRLRALQEREEKKMQAQAEKERRAQERKDMITERKKEKEMLKALQAQEKQATRLRQRDTGTGPKDDLDLEWEGLVSQQQAEGYSSGTEEGVAKERGPPVRPPFPPPDLQFQPWLPSEISPQLGGDLVFIWNFLHSFGSLLGLWTVTVPELLRALIDGEKSRFLGEMHISMLRIVQADMEEAHATGAMQSGSAINFLDRAIVSCATRLEEAWAWGFDVDAWRAHLGPMTWPEVFRQLAIVWGLGPKRPKPKKEVKPKMGTDGEDIYADESGSLRLKLPPRFGVGTVKAAAWAVLAESGPEGLTIGEIARRIQQSGLRDLRTSRTPEASVAGALSRDVIFARTAPATYALQAVVTHYSQLNGTPKSDLKKEVAAPKAETLKEEQIDGSESKREGAVDGEAKKSEDRGHEDEEDNEGDSSGDEDDDDEGPGKATGEFWVQLLLTKDYKDLDLAERTTILAALTHLTLDGPTIRNTLEARQEEASRIRKQMWEEARSEKKRKQEEAASKAKQAAEDAQRMLETLKGKEGSDPMDTGDPGPPESATATPAPEDEHQRATPTKKATPEPEFQQPKPEPEARAEVPDNAETHPGSGVKIEEDDAGKSRCPSSERHGSEMATGDPGTTLRKEEGEDEKSAAAAAKERQLQRAETIRKAEEANATRAEPLGLDRRHNRYWRFSDAEECTNDPLAGCLIMESNTDGSFRFLGYGGGVDGLIEALDKRGAREGPLYNNLLRYREALSKPGGPLRMPDPYDEEESDRLYEAHLAWVKEMPLVAARKAKGKHANPQDDDPCIARLKRDMLLVEKALPRSAFMEDWDSAAWKDSVRACTQPSEFREALANLESSILDEFVSPYYRKWPLLVRGAWLPTGQEIASAILTGNADVQRIADGNLGIAPEKQSPPLAWLPQTLAAVTLRLHSLDASLKYSEAGFPDREVLMAYNYTQRPAVLSKAAAQTARQCGFSQNQPLSGQPVGVGGQAMPVLLPPFPLALSAAQSQPFTLEWSKVKKEIADERAGILPPPVIPKFSAPLPAEKAGKRQRKSSAKGKAAGKGKNAKSKGKSKQSALRDEFDRQSEEEEAAERAAFSTPGFSEDDSDSYQPRGQKRKVEEDEEISD